MTHEERQKAAKEPLKVVITRSCRTKVSADAKIQDFNVGDKVTITREFADELISVGKAVVEGSATHKAWEDAEAKKAASRKKLAPQSASTAEKINELIVAIKELVVALGEKKRK